MDIADLLITVLYKNKGESFTFPCGKLTQEWVDDAIIALKEYLEKLKTEEE